MASGTSAYLDQRVLVLAPTERDREVTVALLNGAGVACFACKSLGMLTSEIRRGAGAVLLTEDVMTPIGIDTLRDVLVDQPTWSELPLILLMRSSANPQPMLAAFPQIVLLERPASIRSVVSAVQAAVRARTRQYQIRDQLDEIQRTNTELVRAAEQRRELLDSERSARAQAERASRLKDEFLATLSHELRTPMTAVLGWIQLLRARGSGVDAETLQTGLDVIERNARLQSRLIDDLLDLSRIISGKVRLETTRIDAAALVRSVVASIRHLADDKDIRIEAAVDETPPIVADPGRLQQIVTNLLSNAIKFTPAGGRVLVTSRVDDGHVIISVRDNGIGISGEFLPFVFDRFRQSDASITRRAGGLGLGLSIVKQLVDMHGGDIVASSDGPGAGALFVVKLPVVEAEKPGWCVSASDADAISGAEYRDVAGLRVLIVDDDADVRELLERLLVESGVEVTTAASAPDALALLDLDEPDVIVSDIGMPDMDGYEFMRRVRAGERDGGRLPAAALTAFAGDHDQERALAAGYQAHLAKPVNASELFRVLWQLARRRRRE